ncbi:uncharacterized protein LOC126754027 [Bactrocera neohumeralis]|uniref:uncharacterized protein LOC126754027 n=1 Tax=Bactrocera neohumeralis TaxID=98809 RepID=UPI002165F9FC|nr:uncharacterized protein LOC126754027 [Bactrocera neohumeralis]XP_050321828.1 uncharacterized protein LOC126754027 [Bactrocera neohumeralis]XP_050321829.1 uncharacterized protein LOC126754027 [Bactrocera neohumeralis]XP_050321830.1 uncharacterized protein LOC126754027 [Bactrocera neohumeralis]
MSKKSSSIRLNKKKTEEKLRKLNDSSDEYLSDSTDHVDFSVLDEIRVKYEELQNDSDSGVHYHIECADYVMEDSNTEISQNKQNKNLELKEWAIRNNVPLNTLTDLLETLHKIGVKGIASSAGTLLCTSRDTEEISDISCSPKCLRPVKEKVTLDRKVDKAKTQYAEDEEYLDFSSIIPLTSAEELLIVETQLQEKAGFDAMRRLLFKTKSFKGSVDGVLRSLFSDRLMVHYNLEGRKGKLALLKLKCIDVIFDLFPEYPKEQLFLAIRQSVASSHNRNKQQKHKLKKKSL